MAKRDGHWGRYAYLAFKFERVFVKRNYVDHADGEKRWGGTCSSMSEWRPVLLLSRCRTSATLTGMNNEIQPAARFRGIVFDMDGVLCDSEPFICEAAMRMFAERHHLQVRPEDFLPFVGAGENRYLGGVAERYGIAWDLEEDKKRTYQIYLEIIRGRLKPLTGAGEFIVQCRKMGIRLAVATSPTR